jgi:8-oxo-dGTP pyrophosphatase MutT (NUDIX family)
VERLAHVDSSAWGPVEAAFGRPQERTWSYPITEAEMDMVVSSTRGQTRVHDVTVCVVSARGELALIRKHNYPPGAWRIPGGGVHPGEDFVTGALREAREETGLNARLTGYLLRVSVTFTCGERQQPWVTHVVTAATADQHPVTADPREIEDTRWGSLEELCGPVAEIMLGTGRGLFAYRVDLHREIARLLAVRQSEA